MADGHVDESDWRRITGTSWPGLFERCLQVVARFEGHGYTYLAGNFDDAWLTWGIVGFTLAHGELQRLLREISLRDPALMVSSFGPLLPELQAMLSQPNDGKKLAEWADSISLPPNKAAVRADWRDAFRKLGEAPLAQALQREAAWDKYFVPATKTAEQLGLATELGTLLAFDIHVQNGSVKAADAKAFLIACPLSAGISQRDRRSNLADRVANSAKEEYQGDVRKRKQTISQGRGEVHGALFDLGSWGLAVD